MCKEVKGNESLAGHWTVESHWLDAKVYGLVLEPTGIERGEFRRRRMFSHLAHAAGSSL
jgi:hypothetical protein